MWWILQIIGCLFIALVLAFMRKTGLTWTSWLVYSGVSACVTSWIFAMSYSLAPNFFKPWFLGTVSLAAFGFLTSLFYFKEGVSVVNYAGACLALCRPVC
jgi:multisubunit Na+/H+ antiporter MnhB subunit